MKTPPFVRVCALSAALLALTVHPAPSHAQTIVPQVPYSMRRPAALRQPVEPTTQGHLDATQHALQLALDLLTSYDNPNNLNSPTHSDLTIQTGGYIARAQEDLILALAATAEAAAFVRAHPESNPLAAGPVTANEPKSPLLPTLESTLRVGADERPPPLPTAVDALHVALTALANNSASDYHGPTLGDIGGHRAKILEAIARVGTDLSSTISYNQTNSGLGPRSTLGRLSIEGVIPLRAPANLTVDPKFGPTTRTYLKEVQQLLKRFSGSYSKKNFIGDPTQGGYVTKANEDVQRVLADVGAALAYLDAHPEADAFQVGPAGPEPSTVRKAIIPTYPAVAVYDLQSSLSVPKLNELTMRELNNALGWLLNNPAPDYHGPILGELGGYRGKIMDGIGQALADTLAGIEFTATKDPAMNGSLPNKPTATPATASP